MELTADLLQRNRASNYGNQRWRCMYVETGNVLHPYANFLSDLQAGGGVVFDSVELDE